MVLLIIAFWLITVISNVYAIDLSQCIAPLGMESKLIPDKDITASSSYNDGDVGPANGRLNLDIRSGAWCPKSQVYSDNTEWIEINLHLVYVITSVGTQGRFGNSEGQEYAEAYMLEYWRPKLGKWVRYRTKTNKEIFVGNTNTYIVVKNILEPPIWASKIRFVPYSAHRRTVCMRVEIYGCYWSAGIVSYAITNGDKKGNSLELTDKIYDGHWGEDLHGGLGVLVDGEYGGDDIWKSGNDSAWVGWRNDSRKIPPKIVFEFDKVREFNAVHIFCNNKFTRDVKVFLEAIITFSTVSGKYFQDEAIHEYFPGDNIFESARNVTINLHHRIGKWVQIELRFAAKWLLISEILFESDTTTGNYSTDAKETNRVSDNNDVPVNQSHNEDPLYPIIAVGVLTALLILLAAAVFLVVQRYRRKKCFIYLFNKKNISKQHEPDQYSEGDTLSHKSVLLPIARRNLDHGREKKSVEYQEPYQAVTCPPYYDYRSSPLLEMTEMSNKDEPPLSDSSNYEYAVPEVSTLPLLANQLQRPSSHEEAPNSHLSSLTDSDIRYLTFSNYKFKEKARSNFNLVFERSFQNTTVINFPRHRLRMISKLAEGTFGTVYVAEADGVPGYNGTVSTEKRLVAVKFLCHDATSKERDEFERDVCILASLSSPYLARVLGVCRTPPMAVVLEYLEFGDLCGFLRGSTQLNVTMLLHMAIQVAAGMHYLEKLNFVHRDLAARNCLVGKSLQIKISDFGADNEAYACDYYKVEDRIPLPIRWAAWESVLNEKYTTKSDVWAFAVTLHEMFILCRQKPYEHLNNSEVLKNLTHMQSNDGMFEHIERAPRCPKDIYNMMCKCWRRDEKMRPTFTELHLFLQQNQQNHTRLPEYMKLLG